MKQYLLDTNICIYLLKDLYDIAGLLERCGRKNCFISEITLAELYYGASNSGQKEKKMQGVHFIEDYFTILPIQPSFEKFGDTKSLLRKQGLLIDDFDLLIGCTALQYHLTLVTENVKHLSRIPGIQIENWIRR
ncbi:MAG TPA: type II toxin-antitoxin system VapC family toxin [Candidatus Bacteroides merdigallinarum]|uniref:Ribonuclease VapC n=1 Tax=Candidatus Bacteroides merdigallinarum TaxID=2838473 RepID=A0A9D2EB18_9BACE|nr:type II toxin-antitoxin system VapC family toxin [Candidatus Bacteroides merdigallinarum]